MVLLLGVLLLTSARVFEKLSDRADILCWHNRLRSHVHRDALPLSGRKLGARPRVVALGTIDRPELSALDEQAPLFRRPLLRRTCSGRPHRDRCKQSCYSYRRALRHRHSCTGAHVQNPIASWVSSARSLAVAPTPVAVGVFEPLKAKSVPPACGNSKSNSVCQTIDGSIQ